MNTFIENIISEAMLDDRIDTGVVDIHNPVHIEVLMEYMVRGGMDELTVIEGVEAMLVKTEGKFPERQAFNKEGWLVTFPSIEYKKAAIQKGTHFESDPTHGQGGMNLYYKKRGKQKRTKQQGASSTEPAGEPGQGGAAPATGAAPAPGEQPGEVGPADKKPSGGTPSPSKAAGSVPAPASGDTTPPPVDKMAPTSSGGASGGTSGGASGASIPAPVAPIAPATPDYVALSMKFATQKGWKSMPYGEWRDAMGETSAVVGLTGEIVPVKNADRDEFKLFVDKNKV